ncbi:HNH endonuclease [Sphingomonas crocodyli]|uniref:HNH endonuclease n=1 Tax=Sphingomonas crocodyli TaxID=1979270 RepID=A0A437M5N9_9SPHN|nr:HNH endonuclease [Sphingomonas crocodyli]RVT92856.1 HNH endonuclease [Sphingomonas crocodyli]
MDLDLQLSQMKPRTKGLVFDLVSEAGFDVTDWLKSASQPSKAKANPKYCYEWSFVQPETVVIFNLWHDIMKPHDGYIVYQENFRANAEHHRANGGKQQWITRGEKLDRDVSVAANGGLPVRVIVLDGDRRNTEDPNSESSKVRFRELDPEPWHVLKYDRTNGDFILARGKPKNQFVDQFDVGLPDQADRVSATVNRFVRKAEVRQAALSRAAGHCELCGEAGFVMESGAIYLETHHIIPLCEGGSDDIRNVAAVCPNDHKRAHFAANRSTIRDKLLLVAND